MEPNEKKINRTRSLVNWTVAIVLAVFLILLSYSVLSDLGSSVREPQYSQYLDISAQQRLDAARDSLSGRIDTLEARIERARGDIQAAQQSYDKEKASLDNWLAARRTTGKSHVDREVLARTQASDVALKRVQSHQRALREQEQALQAERAADAEFQQQRQELEQTARRAYDAAYSAYQLRIFGIRLLFTLPVLLLGVWFFMRYRHHKYKALFLGFSLYSLYVFFFALVPYLPSFGGYVRYGVGVLLTVAVGYYAIRYINRYLERKRAELQQKAVERQSRIRSEVAQRAFDAHVCPSCGRDFYVKPWEYREGGAKVYHHCPYCGMQLYVRCGRCGTDNFALFPYCHTCGADLRAGNSSSSASGEIGPCGTCDSVNEK